MKNGTDKKIVRRDPSAECRRLLFESPANLAARDKKNRQFFMTTGNNEVAAALTRQANQHPPEIKEEQEDKDVSNGIDKLEGCYGD